MRFETRRKLFHVAFGSVVFALVYVGRFPMNLTVAALAAGLVVSIVSRDHDIPVVDILLDWFERDHHQESFPGRGAFFSLLGMILVVQFFPRAIALAALAGLVAGDSLSHLVGKNYGRVDNPLNPEKDMEGFAAGFLSTAVIASLFLHPFTAVSAAFIGLVVESLEIEIFGFEVDDNLTVPVTIAVAATVFQAYVLPLL